MLSRIDLQQREPQLLVLTPTRELAIQVAEAFQRYASRLRGFHVLPIYGGQDYRIQLRALERGVHVVVGTPGRVIDHMRKGTLKLDQLKALVLDEADEMLRMGFIEDVEWVLEQTPESRQVALFSATMPKDILRIARRHLREPREIAIQQKTATAETISQRYWMVSGTHKLDALTRILEAEATDAAISHITRRLMASGEGEVSSRKIGELVMDELKRLEQVAYVRFASVYRQFEDVNAFREEIERLEKQLTPEARRQQLDFLDEEK
jgi:ATP-dependent RNA helicase DeaD